VDHKSNSDPDLIRFQLFLQHTSKSMHKF